MAAFDEVSTATRVATISFMTCIQRVSGHTSWHTLRRRTHAGRSSAPIICMQLPPNLLLSVISPHAPPLIVACCSSPLNLGVDTFVKPRPPLSTNRMASQSSTASSFTWRAHPDVPDRVRYNLEKVVNAFPPKWLREPVTGEIFQSIEECERRLVAFSLSHGFDVVTGNSAKKPFPRRTLVCSHHGAETRNSRKLPDEVERNEEGVIIGERKRELTSVRGTD